VSLLELERVAKRFRHGARYVEVLREVSLQIHERELLAIWGPPRSGRSTLLRIAAGIEAPDRGAVRFHGRPLTPGGGAIAGGIAYSRPTLRSPAGQVVLEELIAAQLALGVRRSGARARAGEALEHVGARHCEAQRPCELERAEEVRVGIARALLQEPSLLLVDEPIKGVDPLERDRILQLLGSLSRDGASIVITIDNGVGLFAADRALSLGEGRLRGHLTPELAPVVELPRRASG
jgi:putative ABC transport system ATP-binding protein